MEDGRLYERELRIGSPVDPALLEIEPQGVEKDTSVETEIKVKEEE